VRRTRIRVWQSTRTTKSSWKQGKSSLKLRTDCSLRGREPSRNKLMVSLILLRWVTLLAVPRRVRVFPFLEGYIPKSANPLSSKREVKERMTESLRRTKLRINFLSLPKLLFLLRQLRARKPSCRESLTSTPSPMRKSETIKSYSLDGLLPSKPSRMRKWDNRNSACRESLSSTPFLMKKWGSRDRLLFSELSRMSNSETGNPARQK